MSLQSLIVHYRELFYRLCDEHRWFLGIQIILITIGALLLLREDHKHSAAARARLAGVPSLKAHTAEPKMAFKLPDVQLDPPKSDPISPEQLAQCNGSDPSKPIWVAIKGSPALDVARPSHAAAQGRSSMSVPRGICTARDAATMCVVDLTNVADRADLRRQRSASDRRGHN